MANRLIYKPTFEPGGFGVLANRTGLPSDPHLSGVQLHGLSLTLDPGSIFSDRFGDKSGAATTVATDTIPQLLVAAAANSSPPGG